MSLVRYLELSSSEVVLLEDCVKAQRRPDLPWQQFVSEWGSILLRLGSALVSPGTVHYIGVTKEECWFLILATRSGMAMAGRPVGMEALGKLYRVLVKFECDTEELLEGMSIKLREVEEDEPTAGNEDDYTGQDRAGDRTSKTPPS